MCLCYLTVFHFHSDPNIVLMRMIYYKTKRMVLQEMTCFDGALFKWRRKDYINLQTKNLVSNRDTSKIGKILVFNFRNDFGIKN